jgi:RNA-directed DNA polymerase
MSTASRPLGKAMYVASTSDREWLLNVQRKLYLRSWEEPSYVFEKLWGLLTDPRNLRCAFTRVARNRGSKTAGVDGVTVRQIMPNGTEAFLEELRTQLRSRAFRPSPARRVLIPKSGKRGEYRPLGIPTVTDRVVQAAMKNIMEPVFEADFYPTSYGFRPGKGAHAALEHLRLLLSPGPPWRPRADRRCAYQVAIEGDIKECFDNIGHHGLMCRVRMRIADPKLNRLVVAFLRAGVLSEGTFLRTKTGSPQGGILSPLLANIALSVIEERYERHTWPRRVPTLLQDRKKVKVRAQSAQSARSHDRFKGKSVIMPIRYADDFILLVSVAPGPDQLERALALANKEKVELAQVLKDSFGLELSETKTLITPVTRPCRFLGHHVRLQRHHYYGWLSNNVIPKHRSQRLRETIKRILHRSSGQLSLDDRLKLLNQQLRGWGYYYRHARGAKQVFQDLDRYTWFTVRQWLRKKHPRTPQRVLDARYGHRRPGRKSVYWQGESCQLFRLSSLRVQRFEFRWLRSPSFAETSMESPVRNESRTPGSEEGALETA